MTFQHWCYGKGQIDGNDRHMICITLVNCEMEISPPCSYTYVASDWQLENDEDEE